MDEYWPSLFQSFVVVVIRKLIILVVITKLYRYLLNSLLIVHAEINFGSQHSEQFLTIIRKLIVFSNYIVKSCSECYGEPKFILACTISRGLNK